MTRHEFRSLDHIWISIAGDHPQRLLSAAAEAGIRLNNIRSDDGMYSAEIAGRDWQRLAELARKRGLTLAAVRAHGPGKLAARLWRRPGLAIGTILFLMLVHFLSGFVWTIDFGALDADQAETVRIFLNENGIREGTRVTQTLLSDARQNLEGQPELFGWIGINFTGGCLMIEATPMEQQQIRQTEEKTALYSSANAEIVLIEVESGFSQVESGQLVAAGQLLAAEERFDRDGKPVVQSASGSIIGRICAEYISEQAYEETVPILTQQTSVSHTLYLLGSELPLDTTEPLDDPEVKLTWTPLTLGKIALPGCICTREERTRQPVQLTYSVSEAQAMARRQCVLQLLQEYPDAEIEQQSFDFAEGPNGVTCGAKFVFCANIAKPGNAQPMQPPQE